MRWLEKHDAELAPSTVLIAEIAFGIARIRSDERAQRLFEGLETWHSRFAGRIFAFTEEAALSYGELMAEAARAGRPMNAPAGRIAAIVCVYSAPLDPRAAAEPRAAVGRHAE